MIRTRLNHELQVEAILDDIDILRQVLGRLTAAIRLSYSLGATQQDTLEVLKAVEVIEGIVDEIVERNG